jgi:hypothetical protein
MNIVDRPIEFLGAYAIDISISAGFKSNNSTCSVVLVEDDHPYAYDETLPNYQSLSNPDSDNYIHPKKFIYEHANASGIQPAKGSFGYDKDFYKGYELPELGTACILKVHDSSLIQNKTEEQILKIKPAFSFAGIIQKYTYEESVAGGRKYNVELESVSSLLEGVWIILNGFNGSLYTDDSLPHTSLSDKPKEEKIYEADDEFYVPAMKPIMAYNTITELDYISHATYPFGRKRLTPSNIINLFAFKENHYNGGTLVSNFNSYAENAPTPISKTTGGKFGRANINSLGYPVQNLVKDFHDCCRSSLFGGPVRFAGTLYRLDLTELNDAISVLGDYRIQSDVAVDMISLINELTEAAMYDYVFLIEEDLDPYSTGVDMAYEDVPEEYRADKYGILRKARLRLKLISRRKPPDKNAIKKIVADLMSKPDPQKTVISYRLGKELSSNMITQKVILGDKVSRHWFAPQGGILPVWGQKGQGQTATYFYGKTLWDYWNPLAPVTITVNAAELGSLTTNSVFQPEDFIQITTNILELRCAMSSRESWNLYHKLFSILDETAQKRNGYYSPITTICSFSNFTQQDISDIFNGKKTTHDLIDTSVDSAEIAASYMYGTKDAQLDSLQRIVNQRFNSIRYAADKYYGKQFLVSVPAEPTETGHDSPEGDSSNQLGYNFQWIDYDKQVKNTWEISSDKAAWAGETITRYINDISFYRNGMGRLQAVAIYPAYDSNNPKKSLDMYGFVFPSVTIDYSHLGTQYAITKIKKYDDVSNEEDERTVVVAPIDIDEEWGTRFFDASKLKYFDPVVGDYVPLPGPIGKPMLDHSVMDSAGNSIKTNYVKGFVKVDIQPVFLYDKYTTFTNAFGVLAQVICGDFLNGKTGVDGKSIAIDKDIKVTYANMFGSENIECGIHPALCPPLFISVPQESTTYVWGPWWSFSDFDGPKGIDGKLISGPVNKEFKKEDSGRKGKAQIISNTSIKPETFGSIYGMNKSAQELCDAELEKLHVLETGTVELADIPRWNITDKIFDVGPYINDMNITLSTDGGLITRYNFTNWTQRAGKLALYNYNKMIASRSNNFKFLSYLRSKMFKAGLPPVNITVATEMEKKEQSHNATNGIFGNMMNVLANEINKTQEDVGINIHSASTKEAMKAYGINGLESFGSTYEQIYSPAYIYDQRYQIGHVELYNVKLHKGIGEGFDSPNETGWEDDDTRVKDEERQLPPDAKTPIKGYN